MKYYYEIVAKCGHVGRAYYYEGHFFVASDSLESAICGVKKFPRVKSDHSDVILSCREITYDEYVEGSNEYHSNPYFNCRTKKQQIEHWDVIKLGVREETETHMAYVKSHREYPDYIRGIDRHSNPSVIRNYYKYSKYNHLEENYDLDSMLFDIA